MNPTLTIVHLPHARMLVFSEMPALEIEGDSAGTARNWADWTSARQQLLTASGVASVLRFEHALTVNELRIEGKQ